MSVGGRGGGSALEARQGGAGEALTARLYPLKIQNDFINTSCCFQKNVSGEGTCTDVGVCWWGVFSLNAVS